MTAANPTIDAAALSLEKAFQIFQQQSLRLEKSYSQLQQKLAETQLDLAQTNKELEAKIEETEAMKEQLTGILQSMTDAVFLVDGEGNIVVVNLAGQELLSELTIEQCDRLDIDGVREFLLTSELVRDKVIELTVGRRQRSYILSLIPMTAPQAKSSKVISLKDITEQLMLKEQVNRQDRLAELGRVAASVAHEIRNPLGAIEGFAMLLERDLKDNPNSQRLASKTVHAARQLNCVVSNLLNYTREIRPQRVICDLNELISESLQLVSAMAEDRKIELKVELPEQALSTRVDPTQVKQVLSNLATNAVEACSQEGGSCVVVRLHDDAESIFLEVEDNGPGINDDEKSKIFDPFFTMKDGGIGLGLSLCRRITESHGGTIAEKGMVGNGAHFVVELPKIKQEVTDD